MPTYSVSCDSVALGARGELYTLVVYTDGEAFNSYVLEEVDLSEEEVERIEHLDIQIWLTDLWRAAGGPLFVCDENGKVHVGRAGTWAVEATESSRALTCLWGLSEDTVFTAGDAGIVFQRRGTAWPAISPPFDQTLFGIGGTSTSDIYVCGDRGFFAHFDGRTWSTIPLPTNNRLLGILALSPEDVLVCGAAGVLFRGSGDSWRSYVPAESDLHSIARFRDRIFLAASRSGVLELVDDSFIVVRDTFVSYKLIASDAFLASAGDISAVRSDLSTWDAIDYE
ncbi:hypothetical protein [Rhizobium azibense]|uniref:Uncharacterized protein n=1 Tax=Rhizobium azibense TaxID=1136135 RepID=A0A4R3RUY7_9HYPH|nr:hypothetical protein [Rhizobium azibense]TCU39401.1 hypothetical protein EV129_103248 [Rhizobium azibense]